MIDNKALQITSSTNQFFKTLKSLTTAKGIKENKMFFLMGEKLVNEFLESSNAEYKIEYIIHDAEIPQRTSARKTFLSKELFKEIDVLGTKSPMLVLSYNAIGVKDLNLTPKGLELICPLGDPRNLGALIRTSLAFGVSEVILTQESTHPFLPHAIKASAGAVLKTKFSLAQNLVSEIPLTGENYALALHGESLEKVKWPKNLRLWVGEEGPGLKLEHSQKRTMKFVNIPTNEVESLNAMVSTSLALWEWKKQNG